MRQTLQTIWKERPLCINYNHNQMETTSLRPLFRLSRRPVKSLLSLLFGLALLTGACTPPASAPTQGIDPLFRDFYSLRGGETILGRALGPAYIAENKNYQLTANALLAFDPSQPQGEKFSFAPLGDELVSADPPLPADPATPGLLNGHLIYSEFIGKFQELGEVRFVGAPLTEVRINREANRVEQYFERLGLYIDLADPQRTVRLLPYGLIACHKQPASPGCSASGGGEAIITNLPPEPFLPLLDRLGTSFTGKPLSAAYLAEDGNLEQVYENVVLAAPPDNLRALFLRPLPQMVGIASQPLSAPRNEPGLTFMPQNDGLGYNVATEFIQYAARHGATEMSGAPTTELFEVNGVRRQCFTNYCLDFDASAPAGAQIRPAPLGYDYWRARTSLTPGLELQIWENFPYLAAGETQVIGLLVYNQSPSQPLKDLQPTLTLTLPDGSQQNAVFPPSSVSGTSYLSWTDTRQTGTYKYTVCVTWPGAEAVCHAESWLVR
ncbi:MAG: hypothetical protein Fur0035_02420 [Anaerolineales bacterium]